MQQAELGLFLKKKKEKKKRQDNNLFFCQQNLFILGKDCSV